MRTICALFFSAFPFLASSAEPVIPLEPGTTWQYAMTQEAGEGLGFSDLTPDADGKVRLLVSYRIDGPQNVDGKNLLKFEMHRTGVVTNTDLLTVDEHGIVCLARIDKDGGMTKLNPPQTMVAAPLKTGMSWDFDADVAGTKVHQHYAVIGEEDVDVPAGKFHAFHIYGEQTLPDITTIDRWFVKGTGIIKDVTTMRSNSGDLIRRIALELKERPKIGPRPEVKSIDASRKLSVTLGKEETGLATAQFGVDTPKIFARWQCHDLRAEAKIRAVWIAENIGDVAAPDYTIDDATTMASASNSHGFFTLSRPDEGWAPGDYRVEFFVDETLTDTVKLKISK